MTRMSQAQLSHQDGRAHDSTRGRNIYKSLEETLIIHDDPERDNMCSICLDPFGAEETCVRLTCRHMFHAACWNDCYTRGPRPTDEQDPSCPNCRGRGTMLAVWRYMDPTLVTQPPLNHATSATQSFILTPRSVETERLHESPGTDLTHGLLGLHVEYPNLGIQDETQTDGPLIQELEEEPELIPAAPEESQSRMENRYPLYTPRSLKNFTSPIFLKIKQIAAAPAN